MIGLIADSTRIERIFWARPLPTVAMVAVFVGVIVLSVYLYRRTWGL